MAITCPKCHFDNRYETVFCSKCGTKFASVEKIAGTETLEAPKEELTQDQPLRDDIRLLRSSVKVIWGILDYVAQ